MSVSQAVEDLRHHLALGHRQRTGQDAPAHRAALPPRRPLQVGMELLERVPQDVRVPVSVCDQLLEGISPIELVMDVSLLDAG